MSNLFFFGQNTPKSNSLPFIITVKTDNTGTSGTNQFTIPTTTGIYNYNIKTSDGQTINGNTGDTTITFPSSGTYDVEIKGDFPRIYFNNTGDKTKLIDIKQWGDIAWTSMEMAFYGCNSLTTVTATDTPNLSGVTHMKNMFYTCNQLISLDVTNWDTSTITNMQQTFGFCSKLTSLVISNWNTSLVTNMDIIFYNCIQLTTLDLSNWDISSCTGFDNLMTNSPGMTTPIYDQTLINWSAQTLSPNEIIDFGRSIYSSEGKAAHDVLTSAPNNWTITDGGAEPLPFIMTVKTDNVGTSETNQFTIPTTTGTYNYDIKTSDGQTINSNTDNTTITFPSAGIYDIEISGDFPRIYFNDTGDKAKLTDIKQWGDIVWSSMDSAFRGCDSLTTATATATDTPNLSVVTNVERMFQSCTSLTTLDVSNWDISSVTSIFAMFFGCTSLTTLDVSNWDTSLIANMSAMFNGCTSLTTLDVSGWDTSLVNNISAMFYNCTSLTTLDTSTWVTSSVIGMTYMFKSCTSLTTLDVSAWDTGNVDDMSNMFTDCSNLTTTLDISNWDISSCTNFNNLMGLTPGMTTSIYDQTLINWTAQTLSPNEAIDFGGSIYTLGGAAEAAHIVLTSAPNNWTITDGGGI